MTRTISQAVADLTARFAAVAPDSARLDARVLIAHAVGVDPSALFARSSDMLSLETEKAIEVSALRRLAHEPVSRIVGCREFWGMDFVLTADTLDPRADTETLVSAVLALREKYTAPRVLDLGTGTGCVLLAILKDWPGATGIGVDLNPGAVAAAAANAVRLGFGARATFRQSSWCDGLSETFDIVVSNPPYITDGEMAVLAPNVARFDPALALRGGADGLTAYRALIPAARRHLSPAGRIFLEIGAGQAADVSALLARDGFGNSVKHMDLAGLVRCLEAVTV
jgi:release factor glutamine methyltransferase